MSSPLERIEGKYEILEKLREGGMGSVYKVRHRLLDEVRVIKMMRPHLVDDETLRTRFVREAQTAIRLHHPGIAQLYDFTVDEEGNAFIVMEYINGFTLQELLRVSPRPSLALTLEVARQTLAAIGYLHRKRIIHRDVSPDNLMLARDDEGHLVVKLIDLGIAKVTEGRSHLTTTGTFLGKIRYSSPEHFATPESPGVEPRSDLYSFGVVLYELCTGQYPIRGSSTSGLIAGHLVHPPLEFAETDPDGRVPDALRAAALRALAKAPADRFASAEEFRSVVEALQEDHRLSADEVIELFEMPATTTARIPVHRPGSTQERLNREFGIGTTPAPVTPTPPPVTPPPLQQVRALLLGAQRLAEDGHLDEARLQLAAVREIDPGNPEAVRLEATIDAADEHRARRLAAAADEVRALLATDQLDEAERSLEAALECFGDDPSLVALGGELEHNQQEAAERRARFDAALHRAAELAEASETGHALEVLEGAAELADDRGAKTRLRDAEADVRHAAEARRRAQEVAAAAARIRGLIQTGDLASAARAFALAEKLYGDDEESLADPRRELEQRIAQERSADAAALRAEAETLCDQDRFDEALTCLEHALELLPEDERTRDAVARIIFRQQEHAAQLAAERAASVRAAIAEARDTADAEDFDSALAGLRAAAPAATDPELADELAAVENEIHRRAQAHRLEKSIARAAVSIEECLAAGELDEADHQLDLAARLYGSRPAHEELRRRLDELLAARRVQELVDLALAPRVSFRDAIARLEDAADLAPDDARVAQLLAQTRKAYDRHRAARRREAVAAAVAEVEERLSAGDAGGALARLERALEQLGDFAEARSLRARIATDDRGL